MSYIPNIFPHIGMRVTQATLISMLISHYSANGALYPKAKSLGAIGGASKSGFITFNKQTREFTRIR